MKWISVKDRLPDNLQSIVVTDGKSCFAGGFYLGPDKFCLDNGVHFDEGGLYCDLEDNFTHWMPLPEPPKE